MAARPGPWDREIPAPYEILELPTDSTVEFMVERFETGYADIHPTWPGAPPVKRVKCIRVHVPEKYKPLYPHRWDITPGTLVDQLYEILKRPDLARLLIRITAVGVGPKKRFRIEVGPAPT